MYYDGDDVTNEMTMRNERTSVFFLSPLVFVFFESENKNLEFASATAVYRQYVRARSTAVCWRTCGWSPLSCGHYQRDHGPGACDGWH